LRGRGISSASVSFATSSGSRLQGDIITSQLSYKAIQLQVQKAPFVFGFIFIYSVSMPVRRIERMERRQQVTHIDFLRANHPQVYVMFLASALHRGTAQPQKILTFASHDH
jgi:hypothetical protein